MKKDPKIIGSNFLDQAPKTGNNYKKSLHETDLKQEIIKSFDSNHGECLEKKIKILEGESSLLKKEIGRIDIDDLTRKTVKKLKNMEIYPYKKKIEKINEDFEKRLWNEKIPLGENIQKVLFTKDSANVLDLAHDLAKIEDEQTRFYVLIKLIEERKNIFNPHSNYDSAIFNKSHIDDIGEIIGLKKYEIYPKTIKTATGVYYGYDDYYFKNKIKSTGISDSSYEVDYTYGYNATNIGVEKVKTKFPLPLFFTSPIYVKLQNEFFEKFPRKKEELIQIQKKFNTLAQQTNDIYDVYNNKKEKLENKKKKLEKVRNNKLDEIFSLKEEHEVLSKRTPKNADAYRKYKQQYGEANLLKKLVINNPDIDLQKLLDVVPHEFIDMCVRNNIRPCIDGKHQVAIQIEEAPSINTGAGLQYGKNVSIRYDGKKQETQYFKRRDGYSANRDQHDNHFDKILDIKVNDTTGEVTVIAKASNYSPKTIKFQIKK